MPPEWTPSLAHLQVFLTLRDAARRVAVVQLENHPGQWMMPSENCFDGTDPTQLVKDIWPRWFDSAPPRTLRLAQAQNYPPEDDDHWMVVLVYEADAPAKLQPTRDTKALEFFPVGKPPGKMFKDHAAVWAKLLP